MLSKKTLGKKAAKREIVHDTKGKEYEVFESPDDGNCFYHSLETWYRLHGYEANQVELRKAVIEEKLKGAKNAYNAGAINTNAYPTLNSYKANIKDKMGKNGQWAHPLNDTVVDEAARAFGINIYVVNEDEGYDYSTENPEASAMLYLHRIHGNHFNLLIPVEELTPEIEEAWEELKKERKATASTATRKRRIAKKAPSPPSRKASKSPNRGAASAAKIDKYLNNLGINLNKMRIAPGRTTRSSAAAAAGKSRNQAAPAAGAGKSPSNTRKAASLNKSGPFANLYRKGFTPNNIAVLKKIHGLKQRNILSANEGYLHGLLGHSSE